MKRTGILAATATAGAVIAVTACGGQQRQDASEPSGIYPVQITAARFPPGQRLAERSRLLIAVRNAGTRTIPDIAVTITDPQRGPSVQAFASYDSTPGLASRSRPVWIVDQPPGGCIVATGSNCQGSGGAATAYANTWALGPLRAGATARFQWTVTAVTPGRHVIRYEIAAGLNGKARARPAGGGGVPHGTFAVMISSRPRQSYVDGNGRVVVVH